VQMKMVLPRLNTESSHSTFIALSAGCVVIVVCSVLLYRTFRAGIYHGEEKQLGEMTFVEKTVKRRFSDQVLWESVERSMAVYEGDYLQTRENSFASLKLLDGSVIEMDAESMIILASGRKGVSINFRYGGIQAKSDTSSGGITVTSGSSTILLDKSEASLRGSSDKKVQLSVSKGNAEILSGKKTFTLSNRQVATVDSKGSTVKVDKKVIEPLEPPDNYFLPAKGNKIIFSWRSNSQKEKVLLVMRNTSGRVIRRIAHGGQVSQNLGVGTWYWHLVAGNKKSLQRRLTIVPLKPVRLVSPQNAVSLSVDSNDLIFFNWRGSRKGETYKLRIVPAANPHMTVKETTTVSSGIAVEKLPDGKYRWQVTVNGSLGSFPYEQESPWRFFTLATQRQVSPPQLLYPLVKWRASRLYLIKSKFLFAWSFKKPGARFHLELAKDPTFTKIAGEKRTVSMKVSPNFSLPVGRYYWRVSANLPDRDEPLRSETRIINIIEHEPIRLDKPPDRHTIFLSADKKADMVHFVWQGGILGRYRLEISKTIDFRKKIHSMVVPENHYSLKGFSAGRYYWRVFNIDQQGKDFERSRPGIFDVVATLQRPVLISPQENMVINMSKRDRLRFIWKEVPGADYYVLSVFFKNQRNRQLLFHKKIKATIYELRNLSILREGGFSYRVTPYSNHPDTKEKTIAGPVSQNSFSLTLGAPLAKPKILSPSLQYGDKL